jgi:hypothetical protein
MEDKVYIRDQASTRKIGVEYKTLSDPDFLFLMGFQENLQAGFGIGKTF